MDKKCHKIFQLPGPVFDRILRYLDPTDIKSLSLSSHGLLSAVENVQKWAPRLHLVTNNFTYQETVRMIPEVYPGSYLVNRYEPFDAKRREIVSLTCSPAFPPTYNEAQRSDWSSAFRFQRKYVPDKRKSRIWLCPHVGCKFEDIQQLIQQQELPVSVYDTTLMLCPFPKCSLWARHAVVVAASANPTTYEMCSTIRIYRRRCSSFDAVRRLLLSQVFRRHLVRATGQLSLPICSHLEISSPEILAGCDFNKVTLLHATQYCIDDHLATSLQQIFDQQRCRWCDIAGTNTMWGFLARCTQDSDAFWLDFEMVLCRSLFDCDEQDDGAMHWKYHSCSGDHIAGYGIFWDSWAKVVAERGFDWRMPLPAAFLKQPSRGLLDFPSKTRTRKASPDHLDTRCGESDAL